MATDEHLMLDVSRGSREAFEQLFRRHREPVWRYFRRRVPDATRAEELAHDTFLALLQAGSRYEPRASFRAYLFGIALNVLMADLRKTARSREATDNVATIVARQNTEDALWVRGALESLEPAEREIVMLREYEGLTYDELADMLQIPINTVRSRLFRARMSLKSALVPQRVEANEVKS